MPDYLISFLVLAYKVENFIEECLDSLIHQYNPDSISYQICLCLDLSYKEKEESVFHTYAKKYPFIKLIFDDMANTKISISRNTLMKNADGQYFSFVDGDDLVFDRTVYRVGKALRQEKVGLLITDVLRFQHGRPNSLLGDVHALFTNSFVKGRLHKVERENAGNLFRHFSYPGLHGKFFQAQLVQNFSLCDGSLEEDKILTYFLYGSTEDIWGLAIPSVLYRIHNASLMTNYHKSRASPDSADILRDMEIQLNAIESQTPPSRFSENMKNIMRYSLLSSSLSFRLYKHNYIYKSANYSKVKKDTHQILEACKIFYDQYISLDNPTDRYFLQFLNSRLKYYIDGPKAKEFLRVYNKKVSFLSKTRVYFKKIFFFYR